MTHLLVLVRAADRAHVEAVAPSFGPVEPGTFVLKDYRVRSTGEVVGIVSTGARPHIAQQMREYAHGTPAVLDENGNEIEPAVPGALMGVLIEEFSMAVDPQKLGEILAAWDVEPVGAS